MASLANHGSGMRMLAGLGVASLIAGFCAVAGDWPQWRGPGRDGHAAAGEVLPSSLPESWQPRWRHPAGGGFAAPVVAGGRVFVVEELGGQETARALDPSTGVEQWRTPYAPVAGDEWGSGPRCTPVADDGRLYVQSMKGEFACLDQATGKRVWGFNFERDYGVEYVGGNDSVDAASRRRGHNGAPVVVGDRIVVAVGAAQRGASVACFDKVTGKELWKAGSDETAYAALMAGRLAGREQVVAYTAGGLMGLDPALGTVLWRVPLKTLANRHAVTPLFDGNRVVVSSHSIGLRSFTVRPAAESGDPVPFWSKPDLKISLATLVKVGGHLYGQGPDRNLICVDAATGAVAWSVPGFGEKPLVGYSSTLAAGTRLLVLTDDGQLVLAEADPTRFVELGRQQVCGRNWTHPALAEGRLYLRDRQHWLAFDLAQTAKRP